MTLCPRFLAHATASSEAVPNERHRRGDEHDAYDTVFA
jgi:hypothetical protein